MYRISLALLLIVGCARSPSRTTPPPGLTILHANDTYRIDGVADGGGFARWKTLRDQYASEGPVLLTHAGDLLSPSLLSRQTLGAHMIDALNHLDGHAEAFDPFLVVTPGNHEFDRARCSHARELEARFDESQFTWVATNIVWGGRPGTGCDTVIASPQLRDHLLVEIGGVQVGVLGITTDVKHPEYVQRFLRPSDVLTQWVPELRARGAELVIALTHLNIAEDRALLSSLPEASRPDLLLGGHDHVASAELIDGRWLLKADADLLSVQAVHVEAPPGQPTRIQPHRIELSAALPEDPHLAARARAHVDAFDARWCEGRNQPPTCLSEALGHLRVALELDEQAVRSRETNAGSWMADLTLDAFRSHGANLALLNSGSFRLNQNLPAGSPFTARHLEELFAFPSELRLVRLTGGQLHAALQRSVQGWPGAGHWLQVAGIRFVHDRVGQRAIDVEVQDDRGQWSPVEPTRTYLAAVPRYLVDPSIGNQDGYTMLLPSDVLKDTPELTLRHLVVSALAAAEPTGIEPHADGRICPADRAPCVHTP